jgi:hypothetical protein
MLNINDLWNSGKESDWLEAVDQYWQVRSVKKNLDIERRMASLDVDRIRAMNEAEWLSFLREEYFPWKYTGSWLSDKLEHLDENLPNRLFEIKARLFSHDRARIGEALAIPQEIKGIGPAGAAGLLSVLFPESYGTADVFVVKSLTSVRTLPERQSILRMLRVNKKGKHEITVSHLHAVLLIEVMRKKARDLNILFNSADWTPRKVDMVLWSNRGEMDERSITCLKH